MHRSSSTLPDLGEFLKAYDIICSSIVDSDDFHRVTYEMLARCAGNGARYVEFFFSPQAHHGVAYGTMLDGIVAAMRDAARDHGVQSRLIPALNRELGPGSQSCNSSISCSRTGARK